MEEVLATPNLRRASIQPHHHSTHTTVPNPVLVVQLLLRQTLRLQDGYHLLVERVLRYASITVTAPTQVVAELLVHAAQLREEPVHVHVHHAQHRPIATPHAPNHPTLFVDSRLDDHPHIPHVQQSLRGWLYLVDLPSTHVNASTDTDWSFRRNSVKNSSSTGSLRGSLLFFVALSLRRKQYVCRSPGRTPEIGTFSGFCPNSFISTHQLSSPQQPSNTWCQTRKASVLLACRRSAQSRSAIPRSANGGDSWRKNRKAEVVVSGRRSGEEEEKETTAAFRVRRSDRMRWMKEEERPKRRKKGEAMRELTKEASITRNDEIVIVSTSTSFFGCCSASCFSLK